MNFTALYCILYSLKHVVYNQHNPTSAIGKTQVLVTGPPDSHLYCVDLEVWSKLAKRATIKCIA